jgi:hypothetical protein
MLRRCTVRAIGVSWGHPPPHPAARPSAARIKVRRLAEKMASGIRSLLREPLAAVNGASAGIVGSLERHTALPRCGPRDSGRSATVSRPGRLRDGRSCIATPDREACAHRVPAIVRVHMAAVPRGQGVRPTGRSTIRKNVRSFL